MLYHRDIYAGAAQEDFPYSIEGVQKFLAQKYASFNYEIDFIKEYTNEVDFHDCIVVVVAFIDVNTGNKQPGTFTFYYERGAVPV